MDLWPGTPKNFSHLFDQNLFQFWDTLQKQIPGISQRSFIRSLEEFSSNKGRIGTINSTTFQRAFQEWKYCQYELEKIQGKNWMKCPPCAIHQHSGHADGNMKLYRFKSAGMRQRQCYYREAFIAANEKVDSHIATIYQGAKKKGSVKDNSCGDTTWAAAGNTLKKKKNLDETGLEILGCRHSIAQAALNMFYGEVYGYAHYLQKEHLLSKNAEFFWCDIMCKYWPWLQNNDPLAATMKPALSVMHAKAHSWSCQVTWGGRWQEGAAGSTGEEVEQINSHFSRLGNSTKHMLPEGREELLTEHALRWNKHKVENMAGTLAQRYVKVKKQLDAAQNAVSKMLENKTVDANKWIEEVQREAKLEEELKSRGSNQFAVIEDVFLVSALNMPQLSPQWQAIIETVNNFFPLHFKSLSKHRTDAHFVRGLLAKLGTNMDNTAAIKMGLVSVTKKVIQRLQHKLKNNHFDVVQLVINMNKLADSSKQRKRLRGKLSKIKCGMGDLVKTYNTIQPDKPVKLEDVENGVFNWTENQSEKSENDLPATKKMVVCQKELEVRRYKEELLLLEKEMGQYLMYYKDIVLPGIKQQISILKTRPDQSSCLLEAEGTSSKDEEKGTYSINADSVPVVNGKLALLKCGLDFALRQLSAGVMVFGKVKKAEPGNELQDLLKSMEEEGICEERGEYEDDMDDDEDSGDGARNGGGICDGDGGVEEESELDFEEGSVTGEQECVPVNATPGIFGESCFGPGVCRWSFPLEFSQGNIGGRNGSNACSLIALLVGFFVTKRSVSLPLEGVLPNLWKSLLLQCMDLGNRTYDDFRQSLPHRYLSTAEAADVLSAVCDIEPDDPLPVRLVDDDDRSTLAFQLSLICERAKHAVATITINNRTSLFIVDFPYISFIDSHCHVPHGAVILTGHCGSLDVFCNTVWDIENHEPETFGNLTVVEYRCN